MPFKNPEDRKRWQHNYDKRNRKDRWQAWKERNKGGFFCNHVKKDYDSEGNYYCVMCGVILIAGVIP